MLKWSIIKLNTNNGLRIGALQEGTADPDNPDSILEEGLVESEAMEIVKVYSTQLGIPEFDNNTDIELDY